MSTKTLATDKKSSKDKDKSKTKDKDKKDKTVKAATPTVPNASASGETSSKETSKESKEKVTSPNLLSVKDTKKMEKRLSQSVEKRKEITDTKKEETPEKKEDEPTSRHRTERSITTRRTERKHTTQRGSGSGHTRRRDIARPEDEEIDKMFETLLIALKIKEEDRVSMREMNTDGRWIFINGNMEKLKDYEEQQRKNLVITPEMWAAEFKNDITSDKAKQFMLELVTKDNKWIDKFEKAGGITEVINRLSIDAVSKHSSNIHTAEECCRILNHLKENESRLNALDKPKVLEKLILSGASSSQLVKNFVYEILVVLMNIKADSQPRVVAAYDLFSYKQKEKLKYEFLVGVLKHEKDALQQTILSFINTLIGVPEDFQDRCMVRNQFLALGIEQVFETLKQTDDTSSNLRMQIDTFLEDWKQDGDELKELLKQNKARNNYVDLNNSEEIFKAISTNVKENKHLNQSLNLILRSLLTLPQDQSQGLKQWLVVQSVLDQIVAQKDEISFGNKNAVDINKLMVLVEARANMDQEREKFFMESAALKEELRNTQEKLDVTSSEKNELDTKLKEAEKKLLFSDTATAEPTVNSRQLEEVNQKVELLEAKLKKQSEQEAELQTQLAEAKSSALGLDVKVTELTRNIEVVNSKNTKYAKEIEEAEKKVADLTKESEEKEKEINHLKKSNAETNSVKLITAKKELEDKFKADLEEANKLHKEKLLANTLRLQEEMKEKVAEATRQKNAELVACAELTRRESSKNLNADNAQETLKKLSAQYKAENDKLQAKYDELFNEKTKIESNLDTMKLQLSSTNDSAETAKKQISEIKTAAEEQRNELEKTINSSKQELAQLKEEFTRYKTAKKLKKQQTTKSNQEIISRLTLELEALKEKSSGEINRLKGKLISLEEEIGTERATFEKQKQQMEASARESKDALVGKIRELTNELDHLQSQGTSKIDTQIRLIEVEKLTLTRKLEQAEKELEVREAELTKTKSTLEAERDSLRLDLSNLRGKLSVASQEKEDVDEALVTAKKRIKELELNSNTTNSSTLLEQIDLLKTTNEDLQDQIKRLELKGNASRVVYLENQINELKDQSAQFKTEMENQTALKATAEKKRDEHKKTIDQLTKTIEENKKAISTLEELEAKNKKHETTIKAQADQIAVLQDSSNSSKAEAEKLSKQLSDATSKLNDTNEELASNKKKLTEAQTQLAKSKEVESDLAKLKTEHTTMRTQFDKSSSDLSATQLKLKKAEEQLQESNEKVTKLQKGVDEVQKEKMSGDAFTQNQLSKLKSDLEAAQKLKSTLQEKLDASDLANSNAKQEIRQLTQQLATLNKDLEKSQETSTKAQQESAARGSKLENVERDLTRAEREKNKLQTELEKVVEDTTKASNNLQKKIENLEIKVEALTLEAKEAVDDKKRDSLKSEKEIKELTSKVTTVTEKLETANNNLEKIKREYESKSKRDEELKKELTEKNQSLTTELSEMEDEAENMTEELAKLMDMKINYPKLEASNKENMSLLSKVQNENKTISTQRDQLQTEVNNLKRESEKLKEVQTQLTTKTTEAKDLQTNLNRMKIELEGAQNQLKIAQQAVKDAKATQQVPPTSPSSSSSSDSAALAQATKKIQELEIKIAQLEKEGAAALTSSGPQPPEIKNQESGGPEPEMKRGGGAPRGGPRGGRGGDEVSATSEATADDGGAMPMAQPRGGGAPRGGPRGGPAPRGGPRGGPAEKPRVWTGPKPKVEMKAFQWQKLPPTKTPGTVFSELKAEHVPVDQEMLEKLFGKEEKKEEEQPKEVVVKEVVPTGIADGKRLQGVSIFLKAIKQTPEALKMSVLTLAADILTEENTRKLIDNLPTEEEVTAVQAKLEEVKQTKPTTTIKNLHDADQFFVTIHSVSQCKERCEAWLFVIAFQEKHEKIKQDLLRIKSAVAAVKDRSKYFKVLVEIILAIGNFINAGAQGGKNGGAFGFQLIKTLSSIPSVRTNDKLSLLTYLIEFSNKQDKQINQWTSDLAECKIAKSCDFSQTQQELIDLKKECKTLKECVDVIELCDPKWDVFLDRIPQKFVEMTNDLETIDKMSKDVETAFVGLLNEWGENPKMPTKDFFGPLCDFMDAYEKEVLAIKANEEKKVAEMKKKAEEKTKSEQRSAEEKKAELAARRKKLEERKQEKEKKEADVKAEELFTDMVNKGTGSVAEEAKTGAVFTKRRLRRQTTLREKQEAAEGV